MSRLPASTGRSAELRSFSLPPRPTASAMSRSGMRRSRESLQSYQQGNDDEEHDAQQDDVEAQFDDEAGEDEEDEQYDEQHEDDDDDEEEEDDEDDEEEEEEEANESVEQHEEGEEEEHYTENEEDEGGLNDTKELEEYQQRQEDEQPADDEPPHPTTAAAAPFAPFSFTPAAAPAGTSAPFSSSSFTFPSATPLSFASSPSTSTSSFPAFPSSSSMSLSAAPNPAPISATTSIAPISFAAGSSSSSTAGSSFSFPPIASSSASSSSFSIPSFTFPSTSSSTSAPSSSPFPSVSQPAAISSAAAPSNRLSAAPTTASATSASVSTTGAGTTIRVPLSAASVSAVWSPSDDLLFYATEPAKFDSSASSRNNQLAPPAALQLSLFRWPPIYGETSTLLHAWHAVFASTQRQAVERAARRQRAESMEWRLAVLSQSHCYRAELEACLYRAVQSLSSTAVVSELQRAGVSESEYHSHLRVLESVSSTWHLFELLYLDPHDNLTVQLTDWMQRSYLAPSLDGLAVDSDEWWEAVLGLLVQGRLVAVVDALRAAEAQLLQFVSADVWQQLLELIETLPSLTAHATSVTQLVSLVRDYRLAVQRLASSSAALMSHPFLPYLLAVLAGDEQAIGTISPSWMQLLVARLIFNQPHTTKADIPRLVTQCIQQIEEKEKTDPAAADHKAVEGGKTLDALREHVLCFRVHSAILLADQMFDMPYFTAHLVDLLHHAALMPTLQDDADGKGKPGKRNNAPVVQQPTLDKLGSMTPRDHYVLQYVQSIISHERLWTLTPEYVQSLSTSAMRPVQALCTLLMKQPCSSYSQFTQLQAMAGRLQLPALVGQQLALRLANNMMRAGQIGTAVAVYQRGGEEGKERVRQIARKLLFALIHGNAEADRASSALTTAMESMLDNVHEEWLDEERGSVDLLLLQHWADYTTISRHLHAPPQPAKQPLQPKVINVFQSDQSSGGLSQVDAVVAMEDGVEGEVVGGLLQDAVTLLASLLTAPLRCTIGWCGGVYAAMLPSAAAGAAVYTVAASGDEQSWM